MMRITLPLCILALALSGCRGSVSMDLAAEAAADRRVTSIDVNIAGAEFERADGSSDRLEFVASERTDLLDLVEGNALRLFTDEELADGTYTGVRLLLDDSEDAVLVRSDGTQYPVLLAEGDAAPVDITVEEDESSRNSLVLMLDLRKSLSFDEDAGEYTLTPTLRAVSTDDVGQITGRISTPCPVGTTLQQGGAVYLFAGRDIEPDDLDGAAAEPYASAIAVSDFSSGFTYTLRVIPDGDYTIAVTCEGHLDEPGTDEDVRFLASANVEVEGASATHDFN